jgi:hypothetical protein
MLPVPEKLFFKACALGFECVSNARIHKIVPSEATANWQLIFQSGCWTLVINGVPQMHMRYSEVVSFLERRAANIQRSPTPELTLESTKIPQTA